MTTPFDDNMMDERNNNNLNVPTNEQQSNSCRTKAELRKSNKPIMEKKRRARINHCLNELKTLILDAMKKDPARHTKLEKADILEMTVKHLQTIQRNQMTLAIQNDPTVLHKFTAGFSNCTDEVSRYIHSMDGVDSGVKNRLINHLNNCVGVQTQITPYTHLTGTSSYRSLSNSLNSGVGPSMLPNATTIPLSQDLNNNGRIQVGGMHLIPSRLQTGELALVMPNSNNLPYFPTSISAQNSLELNISVPRLSAFNCVTKSHPKAASSPLPSPSSSVSSGDESMNPTEYETNTPPPPYLQSHNFFNTLPTNTRSGSIKLTLKPPINVQQQHVTSTSEIVKTKPLSVITNTNSNRIAESHNYVNKKRLFAPISEDSPNGSSSKLSKADESQRKQFDGNDKQDMWRPW